MIAPITNVRSKVDVRRMIWSANPTPPNAAALSLPIKTASISHITGWDARSNAAGREVFRIEKMDVFLINHNTPDPNA